MPNRGFSLHSTGGDPTEPFTRAEGDTLAGMLSRVSDRVDEHDSKVASLVSDTVKDVLHGLPAALETAIRRCATDPVLHRQIAAVALQQGRSAMRDTAGGFLLSRWTAAIVLIFSIASYIGWGATFKILASFVGIKLSSGS